MPLWYVLFIFASILYILFARNDCLANYNEFKGTDGIAPVAVTISHG